MIPYYARLAARRDARERVRHPGKFEGEPPIVALLYDLTLDGGHDDECGDSTEGDGWYALIGSWVLCEAPNGFVTGKRYRTSAHARASFDRIAREIAAEATGDDSEDVCVCLACDGPLILLGSLGRLTWYRCRNCGLDQSKDA